MARSDMAPPQPFEFTPASQKRFTLKNVAAPALSGVLLVAALAQLRGIDVVQLLRMVPQSATLWMLFGVSYMTMPMSEWLIYRRLWNLPFSGMAPLLRKRISNEILLGYSGDLYFYAWARRHVGFATAPFGVIKDVAIVSGAAGNAATILLLIVAWPLLSGLWLGVTGHALVLSAITLAAGSLVALLFRRSIFSLPSPQLSFILFVTVARIAATTILTGLVWRAALPSATFTWWLALAALRMLLSRLPLLPNKDLAFAGLIAFLVGRSSTTSSLFAMLATLTLATHLLLGAALALAEVLGAERRTTAS